MLRKVLSAIDRWVDRVGYWVGGLPLVTGALTWLGSKLEFLSSYGWPEYVLFGLTSATVLLFASSFSLVCWRFFRGVPVRNLDRSVLDSHAAQVALPEEDGSDRAMQAATVMFSSLSERVEAVEGVRSELDRVSGKLDGLADVFSAKNKERVAFEEKVSEILLWRWTREQYLPLISEISLEAEWLTNQSKTLDISDDWSEWELRINNWFLKSDTYYRVAKQCDAIDEKYSPSAMEISNADWEKSESDYPAPSICTKFRTMRLLLRHIEATQESVTFRVNAKAFG